jgi:hypothetical protein
MSDMLSLVGRNFEPQIYADKRGSEIERSAFYLFLIRVYLRKSAA